MDKWKLESSILKFINSVYLYRANDVMNKVSTRIIEDTLSRFTTRPTPSHPKDSAGK